jgi:hypothetical protein
MRTPVAILMILLLISPALATLPGAEEAAAQVQVTNVTIDPTILMPYDTATVTLTLVNTGSESVVISRAELLDKDIKILSDRYGKVGAIGGGNSMRFTFTIQAGGRTGIFYPVFSLDFRDANYLRYPLKVVVQDNPITVAVLKKPDTFTLGKKEEITLHIGNPRDNEVTGITIIPTAGSHEVTPSSFFAGVLTPDAACDIPFTITPNSSEPVIFTVRYQNGINGHSTMYTLPVSPGTSKKRANPILSNVFIEQENGYWRVTGDVTNSGLETANAVEITSSDPAEPVFPYKIYAVGALKPDDFSSFELTFRTGENVTGVPLITIFKDDDGNPISGETMIDTSSGIRKDQKSSADVIPGPVIIVLITMIAVIVAGVVIYTRKR